MSRLTDYPVPFAPQGSRFAEIFDFFRNQAYPKNEALYGSLLSVHKDYMKYNLSMILQEKAYK